MNIYPFVFTTEDQSRYYDSVNSATLKQNLYQLFEDSSNNEKLRLKNKLKKNVFFLFIVLVP